MVRRLNSRPPDHHRVFTKTPRPIVVDPAQDETMDMQKFVRLMHFLPFVLIPHNVFDGLARFSASVASRSFCAPAAPCFSTKIVSRKSRVLPIDTPTQKFVVNPRQDGLG